MSNQPSHGFLTHPIRPGLCTGGQKHLGLLLLATLAFALLLGACAEDDEGGSNQGQTNPIKGKYEDVFGNQAEYLFTDTTWTRATIGHQIVEINSGQQFLITTRTHTAADRFNLGLLCPNSGNPSVSNPVKCYTRIYWKFDSGFRLHICTPDGAQLSLAAARATRVPTFKEALTPMSTPPSGCRDANNTWIRLRPTS